MYLQVEDDCEKKDEASNRQINPLDILQRLRIVPRLQEEHIGAQDWRDNSPNAIESLRDVDPKLRIPRRSTHSDIWIGCRLQRAESIPDDEDSRTEPPKGSMNKARPSHQRAYAVEAETPNEDRLVAVVAEDPVGVTQRSQWVCAEVGSLQT